MNQTSKSYRVIVVDDEGMFRRMACRILEEGAEFRVMGDAESGDEAMRQAERLLPDLVLMDIHLGGVSGLEVARRLRAKYPQIQVVLLSMYHEREYTRLASQVGALGFIPKRDFNLETLRQLLERAKNERGGEIRHPGAESP